MDNNLFAELEKKVEQLIAADSDQSPSHLDSIVKEMHYSNAFVKFVLDAVDFHYNHPELYKHIVRYVASKFKETGNEQILTVPQLTGAEIGCLRELCSKLKNDGAFSIALFDGENSENIADEFPLLTRIAIIATYCASYNPQLTDRRFFFGGKDVLKRKANSWRSVPRDKWHESGPRPFDHQRAMFIFLFFCKQFDDQLLEGKDSAVDSEVDFSSQISSLIGAGLLQVVSAADNLDLPKYRSLCSLDFAKQIARSISPELDLERDYLADFVREF